MRAAKITEHRTGGEGGSALAFAVHLRARWRMSCRPGHANGTVRSRSRPEAGHNGAKLNAVRCGSRALWGRRGRPSGQL
eukprot:36223-Chlamydomonas_euryale.AAC.5